MSGISPDGTIQYVRPVAWSPSPGIPGIDAHHTFVNEGVTNPGDGPPLGNPRGGPSQPDGAVANIPTPGPSAGGFHAPAQNDGAWWQRRNRSSNTFDEFQGESGTVTQPVAQPNTQRPRDPRTTPVPVDRWTATHGPVNQYFYTRNPGVKDMTGMKRFHPNPGTNFAFTPSLRPSAGALGDGRGTTRFRTTQRETPAPLDNQIVSNDQLSAQSGPILSMGSSLSQRWW